VAARAKGEVVAGEDGVVVAFNHTQIPPLFTIYCIRSAAARALAALLSGHLHQSTCFLFYTPARTISISPSPSLKQSSSSQTKRNKKIFPYDTRSLVRRAGWHAEITSGIGFVFVLVLQNDVLFVVKRSS
jgi:hypothetical protein